MESDRLKQSILGFAREIKILLAALTLVPSLFFLSNSLAPQAESLGLFLSYLSLVLISLPTIACLWLLLPQGHPSPKLSVKNPILIFAAQPCFALIALVSLSLSPLPAASYLSLSQSIAFGQILCLCVIATQSFRSFEKIAHSQTKLWILPIILIAGVSAVQMMPVIDSKLFLQYSILVALGLIFAIYSASLLFASFRLEAAAKNAGFAWVSVLLGINFLSYLVYHQQRSFELVLLHSINQALAMLAMLPFLIEEKLKSSPREANQNLATLNKSEGPAKNAAVELLLKKIKIDLKSPIHTIIAYSDVMLSEGKAQKDFAWTPEIAKINDAGWTLLHQLDHILDAHCYETSEIKLQTQAIDLEKFMKNLERLSKVMNSSRSFTVQTFCQSSLPPLHNDEARLLQVCSTLVRNSLRYNPEGGRISLHCYSLFIRGSRYLTIDIRDNGAGLQLEQLNNLRSLMDQDKESSSDLPLLYHLIDKMQGKLSLDSQQGKGSTFSITLPHPALATEEKLGSPTIEHENSVLLIDDDLEYVSYMSEILETAGFPTTAVSKGRTALRVYLERKPKFILVDLKMPDVDGYSVIASIREQDPHCLILAISGEGLDSTEHQAEIAGCDRFFSKPMQIESILQSIEIRRQKPE